MYLKKLELQGFKSFPDRIALDFDNVIAAIVGPNGSGKSNISDAIRWVLGEQSVKSLRGQKWEDVIFSGTQNRRALSFAEVSITLDNTNKELSTDYSDVTVTRKVFRSGESEYLVNGRNVRLKDVRELFMDTGLGKEGYSIISQGRIDEILNARSDERRLIFEEASGIVKYKTRRNDAFSKLELEKKNLVRVNDILSEIEANLEPLRQQQLKAKQFTELSSELKQVEVSLFIMEEDRLRSEINRMSELCASNLLVLEENEAVRQEASDKKNRLKNQLEELLGSIKALRENIFQTRSGQEKSGNDIKINQSDITHMEKDLARLNAEIEAFTDSQEESRKEIKLLESRRNGELLSLSTNERLLGDAAKELEGLNAMLSVSESEIENYKNDIIENIKQASDIKSAITRLSSLIEHTEERNEIINDSKISLSSSIRQKKNIIQALETKKAEYNKEHKRLVDLKDNLTGAKEKAIAEKSSLQEAYDAVNKEIIKSKERFKLLNAMAREHEGFYRSVKEVLKSSETGTLTGICGAVGDKLTVKKEYETAIEISLGASIQNIITEDENSAKRAIEFLKRNKYGRATFLPLTTVKKNSRIETSVLKRPGIVGSAKSLVGYDEKYERVMSSLLERVVIADSMQSALEFAKETGYNYRIVTLQGELLSTQGAITGGSISEKTTNVFSRNREIIEIEGNLSELSGKKEDLLRQIKEKDDKLLQVKNDLDKMYKETEEILLKINTAQQRHENEVSELAGIKEEFEVNEQELAHIKEQLEELKEAVKQKEAELHKTQTMAEEIEDRISLKQSLNQNDREFRDVKVAESANLRVKVSEAKVVIDGINSNIERLQNEDKRFNESIERHLADIKQTKEKIAEKKEKILELEDYSKKLGEMCREYEDEITGKEKERLEKEEEAEGLNNKLEEVSSVINQLKGENIRLESKRERAQEDKQRLFDEMWENYELTITEAKKYEQLNEPLATLQKMAKALKNDIKLLGSVNLSAIEQYKETKERYEFLTSQKNDIISAEEKLNAIIGELTQIMEETFARQFKIISENFNVVFKEMFGGGRAYLELIDKENPLESGIEIVAELPGKKLQSISLLSGGEKALTAIALLFGILKLRPSPFCVLDEIDAALDDANITRFANYLKRMKDNTQFIVITHRKGTMEAANVLYGVTMEEQGVSKLISLNFEEAVS